MVNIKVPINLKGAIKIDTADIEDRLQVDKSARNDLQFLKNLLDQDKMIFEQAFVNADAENVEIIPPIGSTFYLLGASASAAILSASFFQTRLQTVIGNTTTRIETHTFNSTSLQPRHYHFTINTHKVIGNGEDKIEIILDGTGTGSMNLQLWGYLENSVRP